MNIDPRQPFTSFDLHCHTWHSDVSQQWILRKLDVPESHTPPDLLRSRLKERGIDYVTVTDHDTIQGCLDLLEKGHDDVFISVEATTLFPDGCKIHLLCYDITEAQWKDIRRIRRDIFELAAYVREKNILHSVAHPFYRQSVPYDVDHLEQLLLMFDGFEIMNGGQLADSNDLARAWLKSVTPAAYERLAEKWKLPFAPAPLTKYVTGGSDDHCGLLLGKIATRVPGKLPMREALEQIRAGRAIVEGRSETSLSFAHTIYATFYSEFKRKFRQSQEPDEEIAQTLGDLFGHETFTPDFGDSVRAKLLSAADRRAGDDRALGHLLFEDFADLLTKDWYRTDLLMQKLTHRDLHDETYRYVSTLFNALIYRYVRKVVSKLKRGNLFASIQAASAMVPLFLGITPYLTAFKHVHKDDGFRNEARGRFGLEPARKKQRRWAWFTDTFTDVNGVAHTIQTMVKLAEQHETPIDVITSSYGEPPVNAKTLKNFTPVGEIALPEYEMMKFGVPPFLDMLLHCERNEYTRIVISTPGPIGLAARFVAKLLNIPTAGIYHTDVPTYIGYFTGDKWLEGLAWAYMKWFYGGLDQVYVLSESYRDAFKKGGFDHPDVRIFPKGTDLERFHPTNRDPGYWHGLGLNGGKKVLYVGRISKEKDIDDLIEAHKLVRAAVPETDLVLVGDGPYFEELKSRTQDVPGVTFTGFLKGDALNRAFASADVFAFPSTTDTFGSVILEAQASGLPCVVSDVGGPKEVIVNGETGFVARAHDPESFAREIVRILTDAPRRDEMREKARKHAESKSWEAAFRTFWEQSPT